MSKPLCPDVRAKLNVVLLRCATRAEGRQREIFREVHARLPKFFDREADALAIAVADLNDEYARAG